MRYPQADATRATTDEPAAIHKLGDAARFGQRPSSLGPTRVALRPGQSF